MSIPIGQLINSLQTNINTLIGIMPWFSSEIFSFVQTWQWAIISSLSFILPILFNLRKPSITRPDSLSPPPAPPKKQAIKLDDCVYTLIKRQAQQDDFQSLVEQLSPIPPLLCLIQGHKEQEQHSFLQCVLQHQLKRCCDSYFHLRGLNFNNQEEVWIRLLREVAEDLDIEPSTELSKLVSQLNTPKNLPVIIHIQLNRQDGGNIAKLIQRCLLPFTRQWLALAKMQKKSPILLFVSISYDREHWWQQRYQTRLGQQISQLPDCQRLHYLEMIQVRDVNESWLGTEVPRSIKHKPTYRRYYQARKIDIKQKIMLLFKQQKRYTSEKIIPKLKAIMENLK